MDTTGTFEMAAALAELGVVTTMHKHYTVEQVGLPRAAAEFGA